MKPTLILGGVAVALSVAGCASHPDKLSASYTSSARYQDADCRQLTTHDYDLARREEQLYRELKEKRSNDVGQAVGGLLFFWPMLFLLEGGDGYEATEYRQIKGERQAVEDASRQQGCAFVARRAR